MSWIYCNLRCEWNSIYWLSKGYLPYGACKTKLALTEGMCHPVQVFKVFIGYVYITHTALGLNSWDALDGNGVDCWLLTPLMPTTCEATHLLVAGSDRTVRPTCVALHCSKQPLDASSTCKCCQHNFNTCVFWSKWVWSQTSFFVLVLRRMLAWNISLEFYRAASHNQLGLFGFLWAVLGPPFVLIRDANFGQFCCFGF